MIALFAGFTRPSSTFAYLWDGLLMVLGIVTFFVFLRGIRQFNAASAAELRRASVPEKSVSSEKKQR